MSFFEENSYRNLIKQHLKSLPKNGRGQLARFAKLLNVNTTLISQVMSGSRDFTYEQALELAQFMGFSEIEVEYFLTLVQKERAGTTKLKTFFENKVRNLREQSKKIERRYEHDRKLTEEERAVFYSSWLYSGVRLYTSTNPHGKTIDEICERFLIERAKAAEILRFLTKTGLCEETQGRYLMAVQSTFLEQGSPHLMKHHSNWRIKAIQSSDLITPDELMFTAPMSLSESDFKKIRETLAEVIKSASLTVKESEAQSIACLNIDWFWIK